MANEEHINWLLEGAEAWNERRVSKPFRPDLSNIDIASLSETNSLRTILGQQKTPLINTEGCFDLSGINLRDGFLSHIKADSVVAREADFTNSNLLWARLPDADLWRSMFDNAILADTDLTRSDLSGTRLWTANLFTTANNLEYSDLEPLSKTSIVTTQDLMTVRAELDERYCNYVGKDAVSFYFRGHTSQAWSLSPSVMRRDDNSGDRLLRTSESELITELMAQHPSSFVGAPSAFDRLVLARHHKLPTRLLDVTRNPLIGVFFACEDLDPEIDGQLHVFAVPRTSIKPFNSDAISVISNFARLSRGEQNWLLTKRREDTDDDDDVPPEFHVENQSPWYGYRDILKRLCVFIREEKPGFENRIDPRDLFKVFVVEPQQSFERIKMQSGAFLISAFHERFERSEVIKRNAGIPIYHHYVLTIPGGSKCELMKDLHRLNVKHEVLFPGLDTTASAIEARYTEYGRLASRPWEIELPDPNDLDALEALLNSTEWSDKWH